MERFSTSVAALAVAVCLTGAANAQVRDRDRAVYQQDIVGRVEKVRVERDGDVRLWVRETNAWGKPLEGRRGEREVEITAHRVKCFVFHDRGMREVSPREVQGRVMNIQRHTERGREVVELHEMRRPRR
jgi:hypothetical protein